MDGRSRIHGMMGAKHEVQPASGMGCSNELPAAILDRVHSYSNGVVTSLADNKVVRADGRISSRTN
jgi:hypothetical protein